MMTEKEKQAVSAGLALAAGGLSAGILWKDGADRLTGGLVHFGEWLRELSLSGGGGNLLAWALVIGISVLPVLGLLWKGRMKADWLLLLSGGELFAALYFLVNPMLTVPAIPGIRAETAAKAWALTAFGCVAATLVCWALLRLIPVLNRKTGQVFPKLLTGAAVFYAFLLGFDAVQKVLVKITAVSAGNTDPARVRTSGILLVLLAIIGLVPKLLAVWVMLLGGKLVSALEREPFAEGTVSLAEKISGQVLRIAKASLLLAVLCNLLQLLCYARAASIRIEIEIPAVTLVLCAALVILCRYFRKAKDVSDDNATII